MINGKELNNFTVTYNDGNLFNMKDYNLYVQRWNLPTPEINNESERLNTGEHGLIDMGTTYGGWEGAAECKLEAPIGVDFEFLTSEIKKILLSCDPFYISRDSIPESRRLVKCKNSFTFTRKGNTGKTVLSFISYSPYAESTYTTLESGSNEYVYNTNSFSVYNAGHAKIDPRGIHTPLLITFKGASDKLKIINKTTGDEWTYNGKTAVDDIIRLDRVRSTKNSLSIVRDTNKKVIRLNAGINEFEITGAIGAFSISFDFRFYYF